MLVDVYTCQNATMLKITCHGSYTVLCYREAERFRMEEYERELQEMKDRVQRRPLLFEQESQVLYTSMLLTYTHV